MIGAIAGDIVGSRFEGLRFPPAPYALFDQDCRFTDDTVTTAAVAEAILSGRNCAVTLREFVRRHPGRRYGRMFERWARSDDAGPYGSWGNGSVMRTAAAGWLATSESGALQLAAEQAQVSHNHPDAVKAAQAVSLAIFGVRSGASSHNVRARLEAMFAYSLDPAETLRGGHVDLSATKTAVVALSLGLSAPDWETAVRAAIGLGGDTDTAAAVTGAIAEAVCGVPADVARTARGYLTPDLIGVLEAFDWRIRQLSEV